MRGLVRLSITTPARLPTSVVQLDRRRSLIFIRSKGERRGGFGIVGVHCSSD
jgi:hypothetical protein